MSATETELRTALERAGYRDVAVSIPNPLCKGALLTVTGKLDGHPYELSFIVGDFPDLALRSLEIAVQQSIINARDPRWRSAARAGGDRAAEN